MLYRMSVFALLLTITPLLKAGDHPARSTHSDISHDLFAAYVSNVPTQDFQLNLVQSKPARKSPALAAVFSLLLPGLGEHYADGFSSGKYFSIAEGALWLGYISFDVYGTSQRNDARAFAVAHAGVTLAGKDDQFFVDIGNFDNTNEFNEKRLRERQPGRVYDPAAGFSWQWDSEASRVQFKDVRLSSENALNNRKFVVAAIVINHVASAINAARAAISYNKDLDAGILGGIHIDADVIGGVQNPNGIMVTFSKHF